MAVKITDLVDPSVFEDLKALKSEMSELVQQYTEVARELAKGMTMPINNLQDLERANELYNRSAREAARISSDLNRVFDEQKAVIQETTNVASRRLMEQERVNKVTREEYTETEKVKALLAQVNGTYDDNLKALIRIKGELEANKKQQSEIKKQYSDSKITLEQYNRAMEDLVKQERSLKEEKRATDVLLKNEEREMQAVEGSYNHMSQQLELLKKAYKSLTEEELGSALGKELETTIQNLDAHLKDMAADMGEFQRNVGNYAIAGQNGVVSTESLNAVLQQQAVTTKDLTDQNKILIEARGMLNQEDAKYAETVAAINDKIAENGRKLSDVSDIMDKEATSVAEAEAQNVRLAAALKQVDLSSDDAQKKIAALNAKIDKNNSMISANSMAQSSLKKDLKEMILEIATLTVEFNNLTEAERQHADGQALKAHIEDLIEKAGALKDAISDTNEAIKNAASDTRGFDQLSGSLQLVVSAYGLAKGSATLLGISTGDLVKIQTQLMGAVAASNAMQKIQNILQKQSAVMQGVNLLQTKLRTAAENIHTAAQGKGVIATKAATVAQWAFNAAAKANPIGLLITLITACAAAVYGLIKAFDIFSGSSEESTKRNEELIESTDKLISANDRLIESMERRGESYSKVHSQIIDNTLEEQKLILKNIEEAMNEQDAVTVGALNDQYLQGLSKLVDTYDEGSDYIAKLIKEGADKELEVEHGKFEARRILIRRTFDEYKDFAESLIKVGEYLSARMTDKFDFKIDYDALEKMKEQQLKKVDEDEKKALKEKAKTAKEAAKKLRKEVEAGEDALIRIIKNSHECQRQTEIKSYERRKKDIEEKLAETNAKQIKMREALHNQLDGLEEEHIRRLAEIKNDEEIRTVKAEKDIVEARINATKKGSDKMLDLRLELLRYEKRLELEEINKKENDSTYTVEEANVLRFKIAEKYAKKETEVIEEEAKKQIDVISKKFSAESQERSTKLISELKDLKANYAEELKLHGKNEDKRKKITEKYEKDVADIQYKYAHQEAQASIDMLEKCLKVSGLSADEQERIRRELAEARMKLSDEETEHELENIKETLDADEDAKKKRLQAIQKWLQVAADSLNAINDLSSAIYDNKIQKIEDEQEAFEASTQKESDLISELVDKQVISQEEGDARKRALDEKKAKKNEELELKKQKLKERQAIWDKANSIAQSAIATALAVTQALPNVVMAAIVGALGAIQLATIIATPIPKYAKGTDYHAGGLALVGDGGRKEMVITGDKFWITPDIPTLIDLPKGASVLPSVPDITPERLLPEMMPAPSVVVNNDNAKLCAKIDKLGNKLENSIYDMSKSLQKSIQRGAYLAEYEKYKRDRV